MSARLREQLRRERDRRDAREQAYREHVCGGPLAEVFEPIITGGSDVEHAAMVAARMAEYAERVQREGDLLAGDFARRCWVTHKERVQMVADWLEWNFRYGSPGPVPTHSTSSATPTTAGTIPAL
jgi:hypothetical protein